MSRSNHPRPALPHPCGLKIRCVEAGNFRSFATGRRGRRTNSPPQFGHAPPRMFVAQSLQNVHSNVQISASGDSGGRSRLQHSQFGRSWSISDPPSHRVVKHASHFRSRCLHGVLRSSRERKAGALSMLERPPVDGDRRCDVLQRRAGRIENDRFFLARAPGLEPGDDLA